MDGTKGGYKRSLEAALLVSLALLSRAAADMFSFTTVVDFFFLFLFVLSLSFFFLSFLASFCLFRKPKNFLLLSGLVAAGMSDDVEAVDSGRGNSSPMTLYDLSACLRISFRSDDTDLN